MLVAVKKRSGRFFFSIPKKINKTHLCGGYDPLLYLKSKPSIACFLLLVNLFVCRPAYGDYSKGGPFASPGYGARAWGMGGAAIATSGGEEAVYWNPAMLSYLRENRIGASYINLVPGAKAYHSHLVFAMALERTDTVDIGRTIASHAVGILVGNLRLELSDDSGYSENTFRFAYAYTPDYFVSFGAAFNALVMTSDFSSFGGTGTSVDAGMRLHLLQNWTFGFVARNAFSRLSYNDGANFSLLRSFALALATNKIPSVEAEVDIVLAHGGISRYIIGAEATLFSGMLALRGGISSLHSGENRTIPHLGLGFKFLRFRLNYNANLDSENAFADTHRFSLSAAL